MLPRPEQRLITSLFLGTALSISSVKIVAMVVREMNFLRRTVGQLIVTSAIIDDTICWIIIAVTFGLAMHGRVDLTSLAQSVLGTALFLVASFTIGRRLVFFLIRWANDNLVSEVPVITTILVVMGAMALITHAIGVHTVLGAFVAGILVGQSPILSRHIDAFGNLGNTGIAGRAVELGTEGGGRNRPAQRMFAAAAAHDQDSHGEALTTVCAPRTSG